ncbi:hypothetical protein BDF22DRAFT_666541 [Syncephalis plumigaleata]|nr:hypothetical protein BDF22DRAFT_666541 [Syncephalis plumigaleata]
MENNITISFVYNELRQLKLPSNMTLLEFQIQSANISDARIRFDSSNMQSFVNVILLYAFLGNTWEAIKLLQLRPLNKCYWCCFIQAFFGVIMGVGMEISILSSNTITCRAVNWISIVGLATSSMCTAYAMQMRSKRLLWFGILCIPLPTIAIWGIAFNEDIYYSVEGACMIDYPEWVPIVRGCIEVFVNGVFSYIFLQYQTFGSNCWDKLKCDGLFYLLGAAISSIVCALISVSRLFGPVSDFIFLIDWILVSTLLIRQHQNIRTVLQENQPKTRHFTYWYV